MDGRKKSKRELKKNRGLYEREMKKKVQKAQKRFSEEITTWKDAFTNKRRSEPFSCLCLDNPFQTLYNTSLDC